MTPIVLIEIYSIDALPLSFIHTFNLKHWRRSSGHIDARKETRFFVNRLIAKHARAIKSLQQLVQLVILSHLS